jgi:3-hydroxybutyryl-CoA dehydratase
MNGKTLKEIKIGEKANFTKTVTEHDVYTFAGITGDFNPAHIDEDYAKKSRFEKRIAHGILTAGLISAVLGMQLPGPGSIYVSQTLKFLLPVYLTDTIASDVEFAEIIAEKNRVCFLTRCLNQNGEIVAEGESILKPRK